VSPVSASVLLCHGTRGALSQKFIDRSIQQNGRHIEHLLNKLFSSKPTLHFCYILCTSVNKITSLVTFSFIDLLWELYMRAVLYGATYRSIFELSKSYIEVFITNYCLSVPKMIRFGQSVWKIQAKTCIDLIFGPHCILPEDYCVIVYIPLLSYYKLTPGPGSITWQKKQNQVCYYVGRKSKKNTNPIKILWNIYTYTGLSI